MGYDLKQIGEAVDEAIRNCRSPEVAAGELGISKSTLYNLRSGAIADPGIRVLSRLAELLGRSIDEVAGGQYYLQLEDRSAELNKKLERAEWIIDQMRENRPQGVLPRVGYKEPVPVVQGSQDYQTRASLTESTEQVLDRLIGSYDRVRKEMEQEVSD